MSNEAKEAIPKKKKSGGTIVCVLAMIVGCLGALLLKAAFFFTVIGLMPTLVFYVSDMSRGRELFRTVMAANIAGFLPYGAALVTSPNHGIDSYASLGDMQAWLAIYSAAGAGWVLVWMCPFISEFIADMKNATRIATLERQQQQLLDEWGNEIQRR